MSRSRALARRLCLAALRRIAPPSPAVDHEYRDLEHDEYVEHLHAVIGGFLSFGNVRAFECALRHMPEGGAIVEIGSFLGLSTNVLAYGRHRYGRRNPFFTCDPWLFAGRDRPKAGYFSTGTPEYRDWVMRSYRDSLQLFSRGLEPSTIEGDSRRFFELWRAGAVVEDVLGRPATLGGPISFAYIDGDHTYAVARQDFDDVQRHLLPGGYVLLDDSADDSSHTGLVRLAGEVAASADYELVMKTPNYCFRRR